MAKNFKRALILGISYLLVAALAIGGTVAYLTDRESKVNVFTVGTVDITLEEKFPDNKLIPGKDLVKEAKIKNTGNNNAYVWMTVAVPTALDTVGKGFNNSSQNVLHWNVPGVFWEGLNNEQRYIDSAIKKGYLKQGDKVADDATWDVNNHVDVQQGVELTVEGKTMKYNIYTLLYNKSLAPDEYTNIGLSNVYFDERVDVNADGTLVLVSDEGKTKEEIKWDIDDDADGKPIVIVSAYAIQADEFESVEDAYAAYKAQWGSNGGKEITPIVVDPSQNTATTNE